jgi:hypothetical protein
MMITICGVKTNGMGALMRIVWMFVSRAPHMARSTTLVVVVFARPKRFILTMYPTLCMGRQLF